MSLRPGRRYDLNQSLMGLNGRSGAPYDERSNAMVSMGPSPRIRHTREADRFYGVFLIVLAVASAAAPLFVEATLAWALFLAGLVGLSWLVLDRSPHGFIAAIGWTVLAGALGYHPAFHAL